MDCVEIAFPYSGSNEITTTMRVQAAPDEHVGSHSLSSDKILV